MTMPNPRPDQSVSREGSASMVDAMDVMSRNIAALNETMRRTAEEITASLDIGGRTGYGPDTVLSYQARQRAHSRTPEITAQALDNMRQTMGITNDLTLGMTRLDPRQATTSLGHARAYMAQRLGEAIAGVPLYATEPPPGQPLSTGGGPQRPPGGTPAGQTTSAPGGAPQAPQTTQGPPAGGTAGPPSLPPSGTLPRQGPVPARGQTLQALGARIATSGGQSDKLMHAATHLPYVGLGLDAAQHAGRFYLGQREKGRNYQEIEGGTNLQAQHERLHEEVYRWGLAGGMSEAAARQAFYGVTDLGYNRRGDSGTVQNRQGALDFVYHNYNARGMDVGESLNVLQTASKNATVSFADLSNALKDVSDTAGQAGVNAKTMRANFTELLGAALQAGAGPGASRLAQSLASTQASYGRSFQGQSFAGQLGPMETYLIGGRYGLAPGQTQQMQRTQPQEYARMLTGNNASVIQQLPGMTPEAFGDLRSMIGQYGGMGTIDAQKATAIGNDWLNKWQSRNNIDLNVWSELINQMTGLQLDNNSVMQWVVQQAAGNTEAAHAQAQAGQQSAASPVRTTGNRYHPDIAPGQNPIMGKTGLAKGHFGLDDLTQINAPRHFWGAKGTNKAGETYADRARSSHQRDPVLEALIQNVKDPNNSHVEVSTRSGQRVVSFADAIKYFPNELASGNATFVDGSQAGRSVAELTGGTVDSSRNTRSEMTSQQGGQVGQSLQDWQRRHPNQSSSGVQPVTVDLTPEARRLLQLLPSNNNPAAASAAPPQNPYQQQASRSGN